jgi:hypothetical protein
MSQRSEGSHGVHTSHRMSMVTDYWSCCQGLVLLYLTSVDIDPSPSWIVTSLPCLRAPEVLIRQTSQFGVRVSILRSSTMLQAGRSRVRNPMRSINVSIYLILSTALGPGVYSASNRNEYHRRKNNVSG